jgi:hypothetical protein
MTIAAMSRPRVRSVLHALTVLGLALVGAACGGGQLPSADGATPDSVGPNCANAGCAAPPLCSVGCTATCGCCNCSPGQRSGDLVCTDQGCYAPAPASDGGADAATDGAHDAVIDATNDAATSDAATDGGWTPPPACALPFEAGVCLALIPVYAFVDGACAPRSYGGCGGNDNRFYSLEECLATCVGPALGECPPNRVKREICFGCGLAGGCAKTGTTCALVCSGTGTSDPVCLGALPFCSDGVCQVAGCI